MQDVDQAKGLFRNLRRLYGRIMLCPRGKHVRSRRRVRKSRTQHLSRCHYCGKPMVRIAKRQWVLDPRRQ